MSVTSGRDRQERDDVLVDGRSASPLVVAMAVLALGVLAYFAFGMPGMDHDSPAGGHEMGAHAVHRLVDAAEFDRAVRDTATVTINVHVPVAEIGIDGTDLALPFDGLDAALLPSDRSTPLAVYCRSGTMSAIAIRRLVDLGFTDIVELDGGTEAWTTSGLAATQDP